MLRSRFVATATACGLGAALALTGLGLAPAHAQTVSIVFVEPVVPTQTDAAAIAESQAPGAPGRLTDVKIKATSEIAQRQLTLADLTAKVSSSRRDCGTNGVMLAEIAATASGLTALGQTIAAETDLTRARAEFQQIYTSFRVYLLVAPKAGKVVRCGAQLVRIDELRTDAAKVQAAIDAAKAAGVDTTAAQLVLNQAVASLGAINPAVALAGITALVPDRGVDAVRNANSAALKAADAALDATNRALRSVQDQLAAARKAAQRSDRDGDKARRELEQTQKKAEHDAKKARREVEQAQKKSDHDAEKARRDAEKAQREAERSQRKSERDNRKGDDH